MHFYKILFRIVILGLLVGCVPWSSMDPRRNLYGTKAATREDVETLNRISNIAEDAHDPVVVLGINDDVLYVCRDCKKKDNYGCLSLGGSCPKCGINIIYSLRDKLCFQCAVVQNRCMLCGKPAK